MRTSITATAPRPPLLVGRGLRPPCYGVGGAVLFRGLLPFEFGGIRGLFAPAHQALSFTWYLPQRTTARVEDGQGPGLRATPA
jgi:hypothetical protein